MRHFKIILILGCVFFSCKNTGQDSGEEFLNKRLVLAKMQLSRLLENAQLNNRNPRTINVDGEMHWTNKKYDWTEGFFPGSCWLMYELTKEEKWKNAAEKFQLQFEDHKHLTTNHDLGFIFNTSFGNGYRLTKNKHFKDVMITAADSLLTRFNPKVGSIKSWDVDRGWQSTRSWKYPVIIDNMMNLELLFKVSEFTGNAKYKKAAIQHANTTLKNHFREDNSTYHVVDYDTESGSVRGKQTAQGYSDESSWARGQAWGLYGYTLCYRYTKDIKYLTIAEKIAKYILDHEVMPEDGVPYWDYNAPNIPHEPRDVSAAAITVSALLELNDFSKKSYTSNINKIMESLASENYTAKIGENNNFILKHSVGSIPHNNEIDVPLNYADYYYLEALIRFKEAKLNQKE
ncbi:glycoside hydrolase family 88 protein [Mariniflexile ostreae]|uniref:Glycoside hydrolase family 88 protein n=1 Tax=Mariniflexile ostreae TaxID=1520892 RepID=A0ABV5FEE8_9FLAO